MICWFHDELPGDFKYFHVVSGRQTTLCDRCKHTYFRHVYDKEPFSKKWREVQESVRLWSSSAYKQSMTAEEFYLRMFTDVSKQSDG